MSNFKVRNKKSHYSNASAQSYNIPYLNKLILPHLV